MEIIFNFLKIENRSVLFLGIASIICGFFIVYIGAILFFPSYFVFPTISDVGNAATFLATIVLILTILEMREQRRTSYKPLIILKKSDDLYYQFIFDPDEKDPLFFKLVDKDIFIQDKEKVADSKFKIPAYNLGLGAAQNVKICYSCNYLKFIEEIKDFKIDEDFALLKS